MDDGAVLVCYTRSSEYTAIKSAILGVYPAGMICEITAEGCIIDILEHRVIISGSDIHILFRPKNFPAHLLGQQPPRVTFFPSCVRTGRVFFRAWIMGMCARLRDNTSATPQGTPHAIGFLAIWLEARALGYSARDTRRAIMGYGPGIFEDLFLRGGEVFLRLLRSG